MPPPPLSWHVDSRDGLVVVTVSGALDAAAGEALDRTVRQCLAPEPVAIVLVLSAMTVAEPDAVEMFSGIIEQADVWPGTPLLLCAPDPTTAKLISHGFPESVPLFATVADGLSALIGRDELISEIVLPVPGAARRARDIVTEACARWDLPHLTAPASLVASELVTNAVMHARTVMTLQVRLRPRYLYLAVFDGADAEPVPGRDDSTEAPGGRGLRLVELASARWGFLRRPGGKVVWASFATSSHAWQYPPDS